VEKGVLGLRQMNTCRKVPLHVNFLDGDILHCLLESYLSRGVLIGSAACFSFSSTLVVSYK
jgi:hypothetical protein